MLPALREKAQEQKRLLAIGDSLCAPGPEISSKALGKTFTLSSSEFVEGDAIPVEYSCFDGAVARTGSGVSPPLSWTNTPAKANRLALLMYNTATNSIHWFMLIDKKSSYFKSVPQGVPSEDVEILSSLSKT